MGVELVIAQDAEDAAQEVLIKVITRLESFRGDASVRTWAYRIAVRHILDRFCNGSVEELVSGLVEADVLSHAELQALEASVKARIKKGR